jgi:outer membrane immunogenic protein
MFWRILAAGICAATPAVAADDAIYANADTPSITDWTGAYAGVQLGAARTTGSAVLGAYGGPLITLDVSNGLFPASIDGSEWDLTGGATAGYNQQFGMFVGGIEVDASFSDIRITNSLNVIDPNPAAPFTGVQTITGYETGIDAYGTARVRVGYSAGSTLLYATGGVAAGQVTNRFTLRIPELAYVSPDWSSEGVRFGYTYGGGVEHRLSERLSLKAELLAIDLQDVTINAADPVTFPGETISYKFGNSTLIGRVGLNWMF